MPQKMITDTYKFFILATVFNTDVGLASFAENLEFDIRLYLCIIMLT
jgi:hypothetical protein